MYTVFLIGNIASGKSSAARHLAERGARLLDLDQLAKDLYVPGSEVVFRIAEAFGAEVLAPDGGICSDRLAKRAFETPEAAQRLNGIVYPALMEELERLLLPSTCFGGTEGGLCVVEVSNAAAFTEAFGLADEVVAVSAPLELRRARAGTRGMSMDDFDARAAAQPAEEELCALAGTVLSNEAGLGELIDAVDAWACTLDIRPAGGGSSEGGL